MKRTLTLFLIIFCCLIFSGCAQCTYVVEYKANGEITQTFTTAVDKQELEQNGFSYVGLISTLNTMYANYWANKQSSMLANLNNNAELSAQQRTQLFSSVKGEISNQENGLTLTITYPSSNVANLVNTDPTQEETQNNDKIQETWFTRTYIQNITNIYNGYNETQLYQELINIYSQNNAFSDQDLQLKQVIAFSTPRYKSNADEVIQNNGLYYHMWNINTTPDQNNQIASTAIQVYSTTAKPLAWYLVAVIVTVLFMFVAFVIANKKQKTAKIS